MIGGLYGVGGVVIVGIRVVVVVRVALFCANWVTWTVDRSNGRIRIMNRKNTKEVQF